MSENRYLTFEESEELRRLTYEHRVRMANMDLKLKELKREARSLRWQIRIQKFKRFFGIKPS